MFRKKNKLMNNSMLMTSFLQKINRLIDLKKVNKSKLAEEMEIGRTTLYNYLEGTNDMPLSLFLKICERLDIEVMLDESTGLDKAFNTLKKEFVNYIDCKLK